jgi:hypothetical protein
MTDERRVPHNSHYLNAASDLQAHEHQPINTMTIALDAPKKPPRDSSHCHTTGTVSKNLAGAMENAMYIGDPYSENPDHICLFKFDEENESGDVKM